MILQLQKCLCRTSVDLHQFHLLQKCLCRTLVGLRQFHLLMELVSNFVPLVSFNDLPPIAASSKVNHVGFCCRILWILSCNSSVTTRLKDITCNPSGIRHRIISALQSRRQCDTSFPLNSPFPLKAQRPCRQQFRTLHKQEESKWRRKLARKGRQ